MKKELTIKKEIIMSVENYEHCKHIADELQEIVDGKYFADENNNIYTENDIANDPDLNMEDLEYYSLYDYFSDCFDIKYTIESDKETLCGVQILVAFGGPNIYIDTNDGKVKLYWWSDYAEYELSPEVIESINDTFQDIFYC